MNDKELVAQLMADMRQHSSGESVLRQQLVDRISILEKEVTAWNNESINDDRRIRNLKLRVYELEAVLRGIIAVNSTGAYTLDRKGCAKLAEEALTQGGVYEEKHSS